MIQLVHADFRDHLPKLSADSIDAVITDLPFPRKYHPLYSDVSRESARVLKPGSPFVTYSGHYNLPELLSRLENGGLSYYWLGTMVHSNAVYRRERELYTFGKPFLVYYKPPSFRPVQPFSDIIVGSGRSKQYHAWEQPLEESRKFIRWFTRPGETILDPCCGSGTTLLAAYLEGRQAIGIEVEQKTCAVAWERLVSAGVPVAAVTATRTAPIHWGNTLGDPPGSASCSR